MEKPLTERLGTSRPFTGLVTENTFDSRKAYGRLGPYGKPFTRRDGPYRKGWLITRSLIRMGPVTENNDEEVYGQAGWAFTGTPLQEERVPLQG